MPAVSVIIPTFNRRELIGATVESALAQSLEDIEVIVVDDGSTDGTADFLSGAFGDRIRLERLPRNHGRSTARNLGWALARGELVAFLDSDDIWLPDKLSLQLPCFVRPEVALAHCWVAKIGLDGAPLEADSQELAEAFEIAARRGYGYGGITRTWCRMYTSAVVLRRDLLQKTGGFDARLSNFEDWDMLWRAAREGEVATIREPLVLHRTHPGNTLAVWAEAAIPWLMVNRNHLSELADGACNDEERRGRANLLLNMALGEYWRRNILASRLWMWRALLANPRMFARPGDPVWCAPLLNSLLPHPLADLIVAYIGADRYVDPEGQPA